MTDTTDPEFAPVTAADLDELSRTMSSCEDIWMKAVAQATPAVPCPECGGRGESSQGSLGSYCATCDGSGVIEDDLDERPRLELPASLGEARQRYRQLRASIEDEGATAAPRADAVKLLAEVKDLAKQAAPAYRKIVTDPRDKQIAALERRIAQLEQAQLPATSGE